MNIVILDENDLHSEATRWYLSQDSGINLMSFRIKLADIYRADLVVSILGGVVKIFKNRFDCNFNESMHSCYFFQTYLPEWINQYNRTYNYSQDHEFYKELSKLCRKYGKTVITTHQSSEIVII